MITDRGKERPFICSGPEVISILEGRKTQARRLLKVNEHPAVLRWEVDSEYRAVAIAHSEHVLDQYVTTFPYGRVPCRYGVPGDRLWVRETWAEQHPLAIQDWRYSQPGRAGIPGPPSVGYRVIYRADGEPLQVWQRGDNEHPYFTTAGPADDLQAAYPRVCSNFTRSSGLAIHWTPAIHMPRWASRIALELTDVRVQRLREISEEDAIAEGCVAGSSVTHRGTMGPFDAELTQDASTAREAFCALWNSINFKRPPWSSNPWVFVLQFRRVSP